MEPMMTLDLEVGIRLLNRSRFQEAFRIGIDMEKKLRNQVKLMLLCYFFLPFLSSSFTPTDNYLIKCGSNQTGSIGTRIFAADVHDSFVMSYSVTSSDKTPVSLPALPAHPLVHITLPVLGANSDSFVISSSSSIIVEDPNPLSPGTLSLYNNARIFIKPSYYKFPPKAQGPHVVRLHFYPFSSPQCNCSLTSAVFHVWVGGFPLLASFSVRNEKEAPVLKEYILKADSRALIISFIPAHEATFAFVNAIEVFSAPADLIGSNASLVKSTEIEKYNGILLGQVLETAYRINVGGSKIDTSADTLWRSWSPDKDYLIARNSAKQVSSKGHLRYQEGVSREIAPDAVYTSAQELNGGNSNITWDFPVPSHSRYLVRLHFCDIVSNELNELYFNIYINDYSAYRDFNISALTSRVLSPYYLDFVADSDDSGLIRVGVGFSQKSSPSRRNAILNGVEIMRVGSFAHKKSKIHGTILVVSSSVGASLFILIWVILLRHKYKKSAISKPKPTGASLGPDQNAGRRISFAEIQLATNNFDTNFIIGRGGFGNVYKGVLTDGTKVAAKQAMPGCKQGLSEFLTEIMIFSKIRHRHLVSLIGYCEDQSEMILVYEFMENGTLKNHLYGSDDLPCLSWNQRLKICIGSARGLHYLHTGSTQGIIHRDIKSANILLHQNYLAKVADFGISKPLPSWEHSHVSTNIKGSFGYFDPEYFRWHHLTNKSDVYSFGVVLLEVLCARPAIDHSLPSEQVNLAEWAMQWQKKGLLEQIIDPQLVETINANSLRIFGETAEKCLAECSVDRPSMADVLWNLESALTLQNSTMHKEPREDSTNTVSEFSSMPTIPYPHSVSISIKRENLDMTRDSSSETARRQEQNTEENSQDTADDHRGLRDKHVLLESEAQILP